MLYKPHLERNKVQIITIVYEVYALMNNEQRRCNLSINSERYNIEFI